MGGKKTRSDIKLPKHIAGVKLPKKVRRIGETVLAQAGNPATRELIALGLSIAAAAVRAGAAWDGGTRPPGPAPIPSGPTQDTSPSPASAEQPEEIGAALGRIANTVLRDLFEKRP